MSKHSDEVQEEMLRMVNDLQPWYRTYQMKPSTLPI